MTPDETDAWFAAHTHRWDEWTLDELIAAKEVTGLSERMSVPTGYAVELAALADAATVDGIAAIAQVDLGRRAHRHQALRDLGAMATQIISAAHLRADRGEEDGWVLLRQFQPVDGEVVPLLRSVALQERPPAERFRPSGERG